jgi:hypothetical protein
MTIAEPPLAATGPSPIVVRLAVAVPVFFTVRRNGGCRANGVSTPRYAASGSTPTGPNARCRCHCATAIRLPDVLAGSDGAQRSTGLQLTSRLWPLYRQGLPVEQ